MHPMQGMSASYPFSSKKRTQNSTKTNNSSGSWKVISAFFQKCYIPVIMITTDIYCIFLLLVLMLSTCS